MRRTAFINRYMEGRAPRPRNGRRDDLYKDFIVATSKAYADAVLSNEPQVPELVALAALISRMRVLPSSRAVASAEKIMETTISAYFAPNKTIRHLHELMKTRAGIDPMKESSEAAREELQAFSPQYGGENGAQARLANRCRWSRRGQTPGRCG